MKRLIRKKIKKTAMGSFDYFILESGDLIGIGSRIVNGKPWFQVYQTSPYCTSSYYDGDDYEEALTMYKDLLTAFTGVSNTEKFVKSQSEIEKQISDMIDNDKEERYNFQKLKSDPLFLGMSDF